MKDGFYLYLDVETWVNMAPHEKGHFMMKNISREVSKGKSEAEFSDINEVIGRHTKGSNAYAKWYHWT